MRHRKDLAKLGRPASHRKATVQGLVRALLLHDHVNTTLARAKAAQRVAERLVARSKSDDVATRRYAYGYLSDHALVKRLFDEVRPRFEDRNSGFTRIFLLGNRQGDGAEMAMLEMTVKGESKKQESRTRGGKPSKPSRPSSKTAKPSSKPSKPRAKAEKPAKKESSEPKKTERTKKKPFRKAKSE